MGAGVHTSQNLVFTVTKLRNGQTRLKFTIADQHLVDEQQFNDTLSKYNSQYGEIPSIILSRATLYPLLRQIDIVDLIQISTVKSEGIKDYEWQFLLNTWALESTYY